jgi:predicted transcriptional regulator
MNIAKEEQKFLKQHKVTIGKLLTKRIDDLKEMIIMEEDETKRQRLIDIVKEMKKWEQIMKQLDNTSVEDKGFTGV